MNICKSKTSKNTQVRIVEKLILNVSFLEVVIEWDME